jgi:hypothetical protein
MSSSNARLLADGGAGGGSSNYSGGSFHGFFRDSTGKLIYTKKSLTDNNTRVELTDGSVLDDGTDFTAGGRNDADRKPGENYDQWLLDSAQLSFVIDDKGFLVAELNEGTSYKGPN